VYVDLAKAVERALKGDRLVDDCLEIPFEEEFLDLGFPPAFDNDVAIEPVDGHLRALCRAGISRFKTKSAS